MSMAATTEPKASSGDLGQRFFVFGIFAIMVAEVAVTMSNMGHTFLWTSCLLGAVSSIGILALGNWLYSGNKTALMVTRVWVAVQLLLTLIGLGMLLTDSTTEGVPSHLGINALWQGYIKLAAYALFAVFLFVPGVTLDFFASQRGEVTAPSAVSSPEIVAGAGTPVDLTADHVKAVNGASGAMKMASGALIVVGLFELIASLVRFQEYLSARSQGIVTSPAVALLGIVEALAVAGFGAVLCYPAQAAQKLADTTPRNMGLVMNFFTHLLGAYKAYVMILLVLAGVAVCRLFLTDGF